MSFDTKATLFNKAKLKNIFSVEYFSRVYDKQMSLSRHRTSHFVPLRTII